MTVDVRRVGDLIRSRRRRLLIREVARVCRTAMRMRRAGKPCGAVLRLRGILTTLAIGIQGLRIGVLLRAHKVDTAVQWQRHVLANA